MKNKILIIVIGILIGAIITTAGFLIYTKTKKAKESDSDSDVMQNEQINPENFNQNREFKQNGQRPDVQRPDFQNIENTDSSDNTSVRPEFPDGEMPSGNPPALPNVETQAGNTSQLPSGEASTSLESKVMTNSQMREEIKKVEESQPTISENVTSEGTNLLNLNSN